MLESFGCNKLTDARQLPNKTPGKCGDVSIYGRDHLLLDTFTMFFLQTHRRVNQHRQSYWLSKTPSQNIAHDLLMMRVYVRFENPKKIAIPKK